MGGTDHGAARQLGPDHALAGLSLSDEAHWNQTVDDWRFFLSQAVVLGISDLKDHLIATAALLPYPPAAAWISLVLVTGAWRRRGLATGLLDACLDLAQSRGMTPWLDATPAGATVYGPMGFTPALPVHRLRFQEKILLAASDPSPHVSDASLEEFLARDRSAMGFDRSALLGELAGRPGSRLVSCGGALGLIRSGRKARHIGPLFADRPAQAHALITAIIRSEPAPLLIDVVGDRREFLHELTRAGWAIERSFQRMRYGIPAQPIAEPPLACAGPEFG